MEPCRPETLEQRLLDRLVQVGLLPPNSELEGIQSAAFSQTDLWGPRIQAWIQKGILNPEDVEAVLQQMMADGSALDLAPWPSMFLSRATHPHPSVILESVNQAFGESLPSRPDWDSREATAWQETPGILPWDGAKLLGRRVGNYRIVDLLDLGGMGLVYEGYDEKLDRQVALKCIHAAFRKHARAKRRFLREARILSQLAHPNICQIFEFIEGEEADFLVLERIQGQTLKQILQQDLKWARRLEIAEDLARVLAAAHDKGIVHRDLKPSNIMVTAAGQLKVLDFGLAQVMDDGAPETATDPEPQWDPESAEDRAPMDFSEPLTGPGKVLGTPGYMSPEQSRGEQTGSASDLYSFGRILLNLFPQETHRTRLETPISKRLRRLLDSLGHAPTRELRSLIHRLTSPVPANRPSALDAAEKLQEIRAKPRRRRTRALVATLCLVLTLLSAGLALQIHRIQQAQRAAKDEAETARQVSDFILDLFNRMDPGEPKDSAATAGDLLALGASAVQQQAHPQPLVQARLLDAIGLAYRSLGMQTESGTLLRRALTLREQHLPPDHPELASSLLHVGTSPGIHGPDPKAITLLQRSLAIREKCLGSHHPDVAEVLEHIGIHWIQQGHPEQAEPPLLRCLHLRERSIGQNHPQVARTRFHLARARVRLGDAVGAVAYLQQALESPSQATWVGTLKTVPDFAPLHGLPTFEALCADAARHETPSPRRNPSIP